eukprot:5591597-Alexandrium_andersonii.AAC.1
MEEFKAAVTLAATQSADWQTAPWGGSARAAAKPELKALGLGNLGGKGLGQPREGGLASAQEAS